MAKIYWRNGNAWARATIKGVERREPLDTRSPREAEDRFQRWIAALRAEKDSAWGDKPKSTFRQAVDTFTAEHLPTLKTSSQKRYLVSLIALAPHFEAKSLQDIGKADLAGFVAARRRDGVTDSTIRRDLACLSSVFTIAEDWELVAGNPVTAFMRVQKRRKRLVEAPARTRYLSHDEEALILDEAYAEFERALGRNSGRSHTCMMILAALVVAIDTGLRHEELLRLPWTDVDLERQEVFIPADRAKSHRERRVPLLPRSLQILQKLPRHPHGHAVLWHRHGVEFYDLNHTLQRLARKVGISDVRWHDLRRTCGCRLLQDRRLGMAEVSRWLGHGSVTQTEKTYAFLKIDHLHASVGTGQVIDDRVKERLTLVGDVNDKFADAVPARVKRLKLKRP